MQTILNYMKARGEQLDADIAAGTKIPLDDVRLSLSELSKRGEIILCRSTRFIKGQKSEGMLYRIAGFVPSGAQDGNPKGKCSVSNERHQKNNVTGRPVLLTKSSPA